MSEEQVVDTPVENNEAQAPDVDFAGWADETSTGPDMDGWDDDSEVKADEATTEPEGEAEEKSEEDPEGEEESEGEKETTEAQEDDFLEEEIPRLEDMTFKYLGEEKDFGRHRTRRGHQTCSEGSKP